MKNLFKLSLIFLAAFAVSFVYLYESRVNDLLNEGYTLEASQLVASVEYHIQAPNSEYNAIIND